MYLNVVKIFVGTENSQKRKLRTQLDQLTFQGNNFFFLSELEATVTQLDVLEGVLSWKDTCLSFLNKLPNTLSMLTHQCKNQVEAANNDNQQLFIDVFIHYNIGLPYRYGTVQPTKETVQGEGEESLHCKNY